MALAKDAFGVFQYLSAYFSNSAIYSIFLLKTLQFITNFLLSKAQPLGNISDWFYRVEYQQRGSPHIHILIWLEDAPIFHVNTLQLHVLSFEISHTLSRSNEQQPTPCTSQCIISFMLCKSTCKTSVPY